MLCGVADEPASPAIDNVTVTPPALYSGVQVTATVCTSGNVTSVAAHVHGRTLPLAQQSTGVFSGTAVIPRIPRFIHLHVPVTFTASNATGEFASKTVSVEIN